MTDLEDFTAFFKSKGVEHYVHSGVVEGYEDGFTEIQLCSGLLMFDAQGKYDGMQDCDTGEWHERIPAPEVP